MNTLSTAQTQVSAEVRRWLCTSLLVLLTFTLVHVSVSNATVVVQGSQWGDLANRPTKLSAFLRPPMAAPVAPATLQIGQSGHISPAFASNGSGGGCG